MTRVRRIAITVATIILVLGSAAPTHAHSVAGVSSTNFATTLKAVVPAIPGVSIRVIEAGSRIELTNRGATEVRVLGYQGEPFLRVGAQGVFENTRSPTAYVSRSRAGGAAPEFADASASPEWKRISTRPTARWHDHRAHWMGSVDPPQVRAAPSERHVVIPKWEIPLQHGARTSVATGDLVWEPGPSELPWLALAAGFAAVGIGVALGKRRWRVLAILLAALVAGDVAHAFGVAFAGGGSTGARLGQVLTGSTFSAVAWAVGLLGVVLLVRRKIDGVFAMAFTALVVALLGGLVDIGKLSRSQIAFAGSADVARACVALSLGLGVGLAVAAALTIRAESLASGLGAPSPDATKM